jgi:hypothetical protein
VQIISKTLLLFIGKVAYIYIYSVGSMENKTTEIVDALYHKELIDDINRLYKTGQFLLQL